MPLLPTAGTHRSRSQPQICLLRVNALGITRPGHTRHQTRLREIGANFVHSGGVAARLASPELLAIRLLTACMPRQKGQSYIVGVMDCKYPELCCFLPHVRHEVGRKHNLTLCRTLAHKYALLMR